MERESIVRELSDINSAERQRELLLISGFHGYPSHKQKLRMNGKNEADVTNIIYYNNQEGKHTIKARMKTSFTIILTTVSYEQKEGENL